MNVFLRFGKREESDHGSLKYQSLVHDPALTSAYAYSCSQPGALGLLTPAAKHKIRWKGAARVGRSISSDQMLQMSKITWHEADFLRQERYISLCPLIWVVIWAYCHACNLFVGVERICRRMLVPGWDVVCVPRLAKCMLVCLSSCSPQRPGKSF